MVELVKEEDLYILKIPHVFTPEIIGTISEKLDEVENQEGPKALILTSSHPRVFNGGMNLKLLQSKGIDSGFDLFTLVTKLLGRVLALGIPTIAAMHGPAIAAGLLVACAFDYRIASPSCIVGMSEIEIGMTLPKEACDLLGCKVTEHAKRDFLIRGKRMDAQEALRRGVLDEVTEDCLKRAKELGKELSWLGKDVPLMKVFKENMYGDLIRRCRNFVFDEAEKKVVRKNFQPKL